MGTSLPLGQTSAPPDAPLVGISACVRAIGPHPFHAAGDKYVISISHGAGALPVILPSLGGWYEPVGLLERMDGLLFTGSPSNVEPHLYQGTPSVPGTDHDPHRDATTLPLIRAAIETGVPLLCICRGIQELNAALGGTLHQRIQEIPGKLDHRERPELETAQRYAPVHDIALVPGGFFASLSGAASLHVNSLHAQGIDRLADRLCVDATAPDGIVEAVTVKDARGFAVGVQWHPEWRFWENAVSRALFAAFGDACRARAARRKTGRRAVA
ncbi:MAG: gamma-glutamyl-gamma-aminobutyrate hydrolase family protein [Alphaproteobacteria bacterium]